MLTDSLTAPLILVVEDDDNHAELIYRSFDDAPEAYRLLRVATISAARTAIELHSPSLVLSDYRLPDGAGSELVVMAEGVWPVIMMTSHGSEQIAVESMKIGAQDYIVKSPEAFETLARTVSFALKTWSLVLARRLAEQAVYRAKKDWERTFDAVPDLMSIIDINRTILRANRAMADRCGFSAKEIIGRKCYEVVHGLPDVICNCPAIGMMQDGQVNHSEVVEKRLNSVFDVTASPLFYENGQITSYAHVMRDITERKQAEDEHQQLEQQFHRAQKLESLGVLAGGIAHDFNNILTVILGHCYMAKEDMIPEQEYKAVFQKMETAGNRAADLCRQMLTYAGKSPTEKTWINLLLLVDEVVKMLQAAINKNVTIELDLMRDVPQIKGDTGQIQQIIMNLIINAAEAIGDVNGTIRVVLRKTMVEPDQTGTDTFGTVIHSGSYVCLEVTDTGSGMDEETQKRIFEPFYTTKFAGRGLGMSAIHGIIKSHEAMLQLTSRPGTGTTFKVCFPIPVVADHVEIVSTTPTESTKAGGAILLVDDELTLRNMGMVLLEALGFSAMTASNGREALEIYRERGREIDVILLDLIMPVMGGIEAYHELRKMNSTLPIIICSGYGVESVEDVIKNDPHAGFVHKPYNPEELRFVMLKMIDHAD